MRRCVFLSHANTSALRTLQARVFLPGVSDLLASFFSLLRRGLFRLRGLRFHPGCVRSAARCVARARPIFPDYPSVRCSHCPSLQVRVVTPCRLKYFSRPAIPFRFVTLAGSLVAAVWSRLMSMSFRHSVRQSYLHADLALLCHLCMSVSFHLRFRRVPLPFQHSRGLHPVPRDSAY